jgi:double-stranded uracil-DNA glycosylase
MLTGFPPIVDHRARVLVLGSMPGVLSLQKGQYYAHLRNLFWRIAAELFDFDGGADYAVRTAALRDAGIGLWDVLHGCERRGSLDSSITRDSMKANDFHGLLTAYPDIGRVCFNGVKAEQMFHRFVQPVLADPKRVSYQRLPSTSPANASIPYDVKLRAWSVLTAPAS